MAAVFLITWGIGSALEVAAIALILRRGWRKHFALLAYLVVILLTGVTDYSAFAVKGAYDEFSARVYWVDDMLRNLFLLLLVFSLIWRYADSRSHHLSRWLWLASSVLVAVLFWAHYGHRIGRYMSLVSRDLNFAATVTILLLWAALVGNRSSERTLLPVTAGLGLMCTGAALGHAIRLLSRRLDPVGDWVIVLTFLLSLWVWVKTFRLEQAVVISPKPAVPEPPDTASRAWRAGD